MPKSQAFFMRVPRPGTGARILAIGPNVFYFSGEDLVAYKSGTVKVRITVSHIGTTMYRHMTEMGVMDWHAIPEVEFDNEMQRILHA